MGGTETTLDVRRIYRCYRLKTWLVYYLVDNNNLSMWELQKQPHISQWSFEPDHKWLNEIKPGHSSINDLLNQTEIFHVGPSGRTKSNPITLILRTRRLDELTSNFRVFWDIMGFLPKTGSRICPPDVASICTRCAVYYRSCGRTLNIKWFLWLWCTHASEIRSNPPQGNKLQVNTPSPAK